MRHLNFAILSFLFTVLLPGAMTSCQFASKSMGSFLNRAEGYMEAYPDSALQFLEALPELKDMPEEDLARYYLLLTQARDKNCLDLSSDSSIVYSVNYFQNHDDPARYGKSLYYYGRVVEMRGEPVRALAIYQEAETALKEAEEYKMLGLLFEDMAILNRNQSLYTEAIHCSRNAVRYYYEAKDTLGVAYACQTMGGTFFQMQQLDSVTKYVDRSLSFFVSNPDRLSIAADKLLGLVCSYQKQYDQAERLFLKVLAKEPDESKKICHYLSLGHLYRMMGRKQEAEKYLYLCLKGDDLLVRSEAYSCLFDLAVSESDIRQAFYFKQMADSLFYVVENYKKSDAVAQLQSEYAKEKYLNESLRAGMEKRKQHSFVFVLFFFFVAGIYLFCNKYFSTKLHEGKIFKQLGDDIDRNSIYRDQVEVYSRLLSQNNEQAGLKIEALENRISALAQGKADVQQMLEEDRRELVRYRKKFKLLEQRQTAERRKSEAEIKTLTKKSIALEARNLELMNLMDVAILIEMLKEGTILAEKLTSDEWDRIYHLADSLSNNLLSQLAKEYSRLTSHDMKLLSFLLLEFSNEELIIVFDSKNGHTLSKAKIRLKDRLELEKGVKLEDFLKQLKENKAK